MLKSIIRISAAGLLAAALAGLPLQAVAQGTNKAPKSSEKAEPTKKAVAGPFHGRLAAVDKNQKTITVGKRTFLITSETKMFKADKPTTLEDGVVGEEVSGYVKPNEEGKLYATKVNFGPKGEGKGKKSEEAAKTSK